MMDADVMSTEATGAICEVLQGDGQMRTIPAFKLVPVPESAEAAATPGFRWVSDPIGKRHKLGGSPDFIQPADWPKCPGCAQDMSFVAQIDSVNDEFCFADCGLIYVFYCFDCILSHSEVQFF
jgi:hypothetical protein